MLNKVKPPHIKKHHILFVCGQNQWRSPTAERIYQHDQRIEVRSAGVSPKSKHSISSDDITWANLILVMESKYKTRILESFRKLALPPIENLDIPDEYQYMDAELIDILKKKVEASIQRFTHL
jgi:predicted protein tyrosine phosphatase